MALFNYTLTVNVPYIGADKPRTWAGQVEAKSATQAEGLLRGTAIKELGLSKLMELETESIIVAIGYEPEEEEAKVGVQASLFGPGDDLGG